MHPGVRVIGVDPAVGSSGVAVGDVITKVSFTVPIGSSADFRNAVTKVCCPLPRSSCVADCIQMQIPYSPFLFIFQFD